MKPNGLRKRSIYVPRTLYLTKFLAVSRSNQTGMRSRSGHIKRGYHNHWQLAAARWRDTCGTRTYTRACHMTCFKLKSYSFVFELQLTCTITSISSLSKGSPDTFRFPSVASTCPAPVVLVAPATPLVKNEYNAGRFGVERVCSRAAYDHLMVRLG